MAALPLRRPPPRAPAAAYQLAPPDWPPLLSARPGPGGPGGRGAPPTPTRWRRGSVAKLTPSVFFFKLLFLTRVAELRIRDRDCSIAH
eukprot:1188435-Prorocentrum_minimum.AAC.2